MNYTKKNKRKSKKFTQGRTQTRYSEKSKKNNRFHKPHKRLKHFAAPAYTAKTAADFDILLERYQYQKEFSAELKKQAQTLLHDYQKKSKNQAQQRLNLQHQTIITIDGERAKDFDDAVSVKELKTGYQIGVHIADVSYFIPAESELDLEARQRATSVYLLDRVLPMFPEAISNQLCSLVEGEPRLTFSCLIEMDHSGKIENFKFAKTIIKSKRRCTYLEVQAVLDSEISLGKEIDSQIHLMSQIKAILNQKRLREGSIEFETQEQEFTLKKGEIVQIHAKKRLAAEMIIEELMLIANQCAAQLMTANQLGIYRIHAAPEQRKLAFFEKTITQYGITQFDFSVAEDSFASQKKSPLFSTNPLKDQKPNKYQVFLATLKHKRLKKFFSFFLLTSMKKAEYSNHCSGHYGLAFKKYAHFTSPIRRYPDLLTQRIIENIVSNNPAQTNSREIGRIAKWSSLQERKAIDCEREYQKVKTIRYLKKHFPYSFKGLIVKIMRRGMYVAEEKTGIEGLVNAYLLLESGFSYDHKQEIFINPHSRHWYQAGQEIKVEVYKLSLENLYIDLKIV